MTQNRRQYSRLAVTGETCRIELRGQVHEGSLVEESIGGARIGGLKLLNLVLGEPVIVNIRDEEFLCWCRNVARDASGNFEIGLERAKADSKPKGDRMLVNTYIANQGFHYICYATSEMHEDPMKVCLWNRDELTLKHKEIVSLTEQERRKQLSDPGYLKFVATVYGRPASVTSMQEILNFEF